MRRERQRAREQHKPHPHTHTPTLTHEFPHLTPTLTPTLTLTLTQEREAHEALDRLRRLPLTHLLPQLAACTIDGALAAMAASPLLPLVSHTLTRTPHASLRTAAGQPHHNPHS